MQQPSRADDRGQSSSKEGSHLASLLRDLKGERVKLRGQSQDSLKNPSSNLARKGLRNVFLKLLFRYPFSSRTAGVESELWTETTLGGVNSFRSDAKKIETQFKLLRERIASQANNAEDLQDAELVLAQQYVKSLGHFRSYIASELVFWREVMGRVVRVFNVEEARPHLQALGIASDRSAPEYMLNDSNESNTGLDRIAVGDREEEELEIQGRLPANRQRLIEIIHKCLIACGDLSRYSELYKESKSNESAVLHAQSRKRGGGGRGGRGRGGPHRGGHHHASREAVALVFSAGKAIERDYSQARGYYQQARDLVPSHGQSLNQIAVLFNYAGDTFAATYYYYRALCVTNPFRQAKKNMEATLTRAVDRWQEHGGIQDASFLLERGDLEQRRKCVLDVLVVLHGYTFESSQSSAPRELFEMCRKSLSSLMLERVLAADAIVQVVVAAIASLWTRRLWRGEASKKDASPAANANAEQAILLHLLGVMMALMEVSTLETREALDFSRNQPLSDPTSSFDDSNQVAKNITAVFRRILPAMRVSSKWLKSHVEYIERNKSQAQKSSQSSSAAESADHTRDDVSDQVRKDLDQAIDMFWSRYIDFINVIRFAFPFDRLPKLGTLGQSGMTSLDFEEDRDMRGFLPMKKAMLIDAKTNVDNRDGQQEGHLHPNEEHLIRIADLLIDAKVIAEAESSPVRFDDEKFSFRLSSSIGQSQTDASLARSSAVDVPAFEQSLSRSVDSKWEHGSESTEDAVDLAMRAVDERRRALGGARGGKTDNEDEDDDDGEIILIPAHGRLGVRSDSPAAPSSSAPSKDEAKEVAAQEPLTAQHLLLKMLNGGASEGGGGGRGSGASSQASPQPSTPQPQLLFGGINSAAPQGSFGAPLTSHFGGTWNGNDAAHFLNSRQMESRQSTDAFAHTALDPTSPWNPPNAHQRPEGWR